MKQTITLYSSDYCGNCKVIQMYLDAMEIPYKTKDINNEKYKEEIVSRGFRTIPILAVDGEFHIVTSHNLKEILKDVL